MEYGIMKKLRTLLCMTLAVVLLAPSAGASATTKSDLSVSSYNTFLANPIQSRLADSQSSLPAAAYAYITDATVDESVGTTSKSIEEIAAEKANILVDTYGLVSLQYAIKDNGNTILSASAGYRDVAKKVAPSKETMYGIGSVSKMFTTVAVMQLVDQGKVDLDKSVVSYIPEFKMADKRYKDITVRMLLNHSSGLMGSTLSNSVLLGDSSTYAHDNFLSILSKQYLKYNPGSSSVYCNDGFMLAELLVEKISGVTFTEYVEENICKPLGLTNTKTPVSDFKKNRLAKTYDTNGQATPYEALNSIGAGGIYSTAEDLCTFGSIFMHNNSLLSSSSKKAMENMECLRGFWTSDTTNSFIAYGLGWDSVKFTPFSNHGVKALVKGGDTLYYHGSLTVLPEYNISISAVSSEGSSTILELFTNCVMMEYLSQKHIIQIKEDVEEQPTYEFVDLPKDASSYVGTYASVLYPLMDLSVRDNTLVLNIYGQELVFQYTSEGFYLDSTGTVQLRFVMHNGIPYLDCTETSTLPSIGSCTMAYLLGCRITDNPLSASVKKVWEKRDGKMYYLVNEKYTSANYTIGGLSSITQGVSLSTSVEGYIYNMKIIDENTCMHDLEVPVSYGRDGSYTTFKTKNGVEYMMSGGYVFISEDGIKNLPNKASMTVKIPSTGYNVFYDITAKTANKKATITVPKEASFVVFDQDGSVVTNYYLNSQKTVKLPKGGKILFIGSKGAKFTVKLK